MTRQGKRDARNVRVLQRMFMQEQARTIDSKAGSSLLAQADRMNGPDYKTPAYTTDADFHANLAASVATWRRNRRLR